MAFNNIDSKVGSLTMVGIAALTAGQIGVIHSEMQGGENPSGTIDRKYNQTINVADFPVNGFSLYKEQMQKEKAALVDKVFTLKGEATEDGKVIFDGKKTGVEKCALSKFEMSTTVRTEDGQTKIDVIFKTQDRSGEPLKVTSLPISINVAAGLFLEGDANVKVGCDVLFSDNNDPSTVYVARYDSKSKATFKMDEYNKRFDKVEEPKVPTLSNPVMK
ncbi:MAG: hypothetical protein WCK31_03125 [bacterium]